MKNYFKIKNSQRGFTLIETLVAIAIFASAITGLVAITASGVSNTNFVKNKFTAGYLALEGAELVHNIRDSASIAGATWNDIFDTTQPYLGACTSNDGTKACTIDPWDDILNPIECSVDGCIDLVYQRSTGGFSYHGADNNDYFGSIFNRTITVEIISPNEVKVISKVEWFQGTRRHNVTYSYNLFNWITP